MTSLGDERTRCAARPLLVNVPPAGVATPLPPHIQGAERRSERRARRTGSRWGLRVLVVGGLAGAAWLLTGAAAHAADRADGPTGSLLGSLVNGGVVDVSDGHRHGDLIAPVSGLLTAAAQPLEAVPVLHHRHHVVADILEVPQRVLTRPVDTVREVAHGSSRTTVDAASGGVDTVLPGVAGPLRLTGGPAATQQRLTPVTDDVTPDADPVAERSQPAIVAPVSHAPIIQALRAPITVAEIGGPARHLKAVSAVIAHRHPVNRRAQAGPATAEERTPGGDGSAPLHLHLGDVSGTPTSGSGTPTEGGSAAFLPAAIASSTMACQRLPIASDVEVRRTDAEAPTVSPD